MNLIYLHLLQYLNLCTFSLQSFLWEVSNKKHQRKMKWTIVILILVALMCLSFQYSDASPDAQMGQWAPYGRRKRAVENTNASSAEEKDGSSFSKIKSKIKPLAKKIGLSTLKSVLKSVIEKKVDYLLKPFYQWLIWFYGWWIVDELIIFHLLFQCILVYFILFYFILLYLIINDWFTIKLYFRKYTFFGIW